MQTIRFQSGFLTSASIAAILSLSVTAHGTAPDYQTWTTPGTLPRGLTAGADGWLWSADSNENTIHRIDPGTGVSELAVTINGPNDLLRGIAIGNGNLWMTITTNKSVWSVWKVAMADLPPPATPLSLAGNPVVSKILDAPASEWPNGLAYSNRNGAEEIWLAAKDKIYTFDAHNFGGPTSVLPSPFPDRPKGLVYHDDRLWVVTEGSAHRLYHVFFGGEEGLAIREYPMYSGTWRAIAISNGELWVCDAKLATVTRYAFDLGTLFAEKFVPATELSVWGAGGYLADDTPWSVLWQVPYLSTLPVPAGLGGPTYPHIKRIMLSQHGAGANVEARKVKKTRPNLLFFEIETNLDIHWLNQGRIQVRLG